VRGGVRKTLVSEFTNSGLLFFFPGARRLPLILV